MKFNKLKAFTLAEVMVILLTLSILMAAFAPVFTRRYSNVTTDEVWTFVAGDTERNAYFDAPNKVYLNQAFIGIQPHDATAVDDLVKVSSTGQPLYSKVVISASSKLQKGGSPQQQMQFRYGSSDMGLLTATLFAGNRNMLLGGPYSDIKNDAVENTAFGIGALKSITTGNSNTAVGYNALYSVTTGHYNTAIGYRAGASLEDGYGNVFVGTNAGADTSASVIYNTLIGVNSGQNLKGSRNTAIGNYTLTADGTQSGNTAVGYMALNKTKGSYNTAVGALALKTMVYGDYNTAIGYNSCNFIGAGSNSKISKITCIGANSAAVDSSSPSGAAALPIGDDDPDRVFIGSSPNWYVSDKQHPFSVLEVHNSLSKPNDSLMPNPGGNESVIINGNLVVRGQPYFETKIFRRAQPGEDYGKHVPKGLMLFKLYNHYQLGTSSKVLAGYDGIHRVAASYQGCRGCQQHKFNNIRTNCICTAVGPGYNGNTSYADYSDTSATRYSSTSYDWSSSVSGSNGIGSCVSSAATYKDKSTGNTITLSYSPRGASGTSGAKEWHSREVDNPQSHYGADNLSCCPVLSSDVRLKNVGEKFTAGLNEIRRLNVYNYTFKNDKNKLPRVGVIAQDLKAVFPKAVIAGDDGYYRIRWDEMLYAVVNAVKTLNSKIVALANSVSTDKQRVAALKKDNAEMYAKLDKLVAELEELEAKKK